MRTARIIFALLRVPSLFSSLLLFPLLGSLLIVILQLSVSGSAIRYIQDENRIITAKEKQSDDKDWQFLRVLLYGNGRPLQSSQICIWKQDPINSSLELPPSPECNPDRLDVALHVADGMTVDTQEYLRLINGNSSRLHLCKTCSPDLELFVEASGNRVKAHSAYGLMLYGLLILDKEIQDQYLSLKTQKQSLKEKFGAVSFVSPDLKAPVQISSLEISLILIANIAAMVVIALWLGLKAHRKVLDYFSKSGALLPMVAATGKTPFYLAMWGITLLRVGLFLLASIPLFFIMLGTASGEDGIRSVFGANLAHSLLWLLALLSSMGLATLVASISDLKGRHQFWSFLYRIIPLFISALGIFLWGLSFLSISPSAGIFRNLLLAIPVIGIGPIIIAPVVQPEFYILLIHSFLSSLLIWILLRKNARWFAAHLEEL